MKSFLKTLAKIVAIIAIIVLIATVAYMAMNWEAGMLTQVIGGSAGVLGFKVTFGTVLLVAAGALIVAGIISPEGVKSGLDRVVTSTATIAQGAAKATGGLIKGTLKGLSHGLGVSLPKLLLWAGLAVGGVLLFRGLFSDDEDEEARGYDAATVQPAIAHKQSVSNSSNGAVTAENLF